jgi:hypothetical protein
MKEPIFTLRAQDRFAPMMIRLWADLVRATGQIEKAEDAQRIANEMDSWGLANKRKFPD